MHGRCDAGCLLRNESTTLHVRIACTQHRNLRTWLQPSAQLSELASSRCASRANLAISRLRFLSSARAAAAPPQPPRPPPPRPPTRNFDSRAAFDIRTSLRKGGGGVRTPLISPPSMAAPGAALGSVAVNTEAYVQLLGLGLDGCGTVNSALLVFDKTRFLFNAGEGFQVRETCEGSFRCAHAPRSASA